MTRRQAPQTPLPFVTRDLSQRLSADAHARALELLQQLLIDAVLGDRRPQEKKHEREDPADPP